MASSLKTDGSNLHRSGRSGKPVLSHPPLRDGGAAVDDDRLLGDDPRGSGEARAYPWRREKLFHLWAHDRADLLGRPRTLGSERRVEVRLDIIKGSAQTVLAK
jgi:hypothetical protein